MANASPPMVPGRPGSLTAPIVPGKIDCFMCGACCVAPDITALGKAVGVPCPHLQPDNRCGIYETRPEICRKHTADEICLMIDAPTLDERVEKYLALFDLRRA
jgi:hypothetical protein